MTNLAALGTEPRGLEQWLRTESKRQRNMVPLKFESPTSDTGQGLTLYKAVSCVQICSLQLCFLCSITLVINTLCATVGRVCIACIYALFIFLDSAPSMKLHGSSSVLASPPSWTWVTFSNCSLLSLSLSGITTQTWASSHCLDELHLWGAEKGLLTSQRHQPPPTCKSQNLNHLYNSKKIKIKPVSQLYIGKLP